MKYVRSSTLMPIVNMWCAQTTKPITPIATIRIDHAEVAEDRLAAEGRDDLADDAEARNDHDVHFGVSEEPEQVLVEDGITPA